MISLFRDENLKPSWASCCWPRCNNHVETKLKESTIRLQLNDKDCLLGWWTNADRNWCCFSALRESKSKSGEDRSMWGNKWQLQLLPNDLIVASLNAESRDFLKRLEKTEMNNRVWLYWNAIGKTILRQELKKRIDASRPLSGPCELWSPPMEQTSWKGGK